MVAGNKSDREIPACGGCIPLQMALEKDPIGTVPDASPLPQLQLPAGLQETKELEEGGRRDPEFVQGMEGQMNKFARCGPGEQKLRIKKSVSI